jgi:hypothetical protein
LFYQQVLAQQPKDKNKIYSLHEPDVYVTEVTNAKAAVFNLFNIGSALLNAMTLCQLVKAIDDFNSKFGIGGVSDVQLANTINWTVFDDAFEQHYSQDNGRPSKPIRLMVGLLLLKQRKSWLICLWLLLVLLL